MICFYVTDLCFNILCYWITSPYSLRTMDDNWIVTFQNINNT